MSGIRHTITPEAIESIVSPRSPGVLDRRAVEHQGQLVSESPSGSLGADIEVIQDAAIFSGIIVAVSLWSIVALLRSQFVVSLQETHRLTLVFSGSLFLSAVAIAFRGYVVELFELRFAVDCSAGIMLYVLSIVGAAAFYSTIGLWDEISARCGTSSWASVVKTLVFWQLFLLLIGLVFGSGIIFSELVIYGGCRISGNPFPDDDGYTMWFIGMLIGCGLGAYVQRRDSRKRSKREVESPSGE